MIEMVFI